MTVAWERKQRCAGFCQEEYRHTASWRSHRWRQTDTREVHEWIALSARETVWYWSEWALLGKICYSAWFHTWVIPGWFVRPWLGAWTVLQRLEPLVSTVTRRKFLESRAFQYAINRGPTDYGEHFPDSKKAKEFRKNRPNRHIIREGVTTYSIPIPTKHTVRLWERNLSLFDSNIWRS